MLKPKFEVTEDNTEDFLKMIKKFKNDHVLVGIPQEDNGRQDPEQPINNAALLFINNFGSPGQNIPARPVMEIGIQMSKDAVSEEFKKAIQNAFKSGHDAVNQYYNRAGIIASNAIKKVINDQIGIEPPAESTIKGRESRGFNGKKSLIVTGQMRNAITYVVKEF